MLSTKDAEHRDLEYCMSGGVAEKALPRAEFHGPIYNFFFMNSDNPTFSNKK